MTSTQKTSDPVSMNSMLGFIPTLTVRSIHSSVILLVFLPYFVADVYTMLILPMHVSHRRSIMLNPLIADGVYRAGFSTTQEAYTPAVHDVFDALDKVEKLLEGKDYLVGDRLTEADIRLWVTIVSTRLPYRNLC